MTNIFLQISLMGVNLFLALGVWFSVNAAQFASKDFFKSKGIEDGAASH
jgi:hypothetical protein